MSVKTNVTTPNGMCRADVVTGTSTTARQSSIADGDSTTLELTTRDFDLASLTYRSSCRRIRHQRASAYGTSIFLASVDLGPLVVEYVRRLKTLGILHTSRIKQTVQVVDFVLDNTREEPLIAVG